MSDTKISETEAIIQVIREGGVGDFVDVVNRVEKQFRLKVTSAQVEDIFYELAKKDKETKVELATTQPPTVVETNREKSQMRPGSRVSFEMTSKIPEATEAEKPQASSPAASQKSAEESTAVELAYGLHFVKSVGGLENAKRVMAELESTLLGN